jgi:hypothetical protein
VSLASRLEQALTAVAEALESGDALAAGDRVPAEALPALLRVQARADAAARAASERLAHEMDLASIGRRATEAYGR